MFTRFPFRPTLLLLSTLCIVLSCSPQANAQTTNTWETLAPMPVSLTRTNGTIYHDQLIVVSGEPLAFGGEQAQVQYYNIATNQWAAGVNIDAPLVAMGVGVDSLDRFVVFAGYEGVGDQWTSSSSAYQYDVIQGELDGIARFGMQYTANTMDDQNRIYAVGGAGGNFNGIASMYRYDANLDIWEPLAPPPFGRWGGQAAFDGMGHIVYAGGFTEYYNRVAHADAAIYDIATDTWTMTTPMPEGRANGKAVLGADGLIYFLDGEHANYARTNTVYIFDPVAHTWSSGPGTHGARVEFAAGLGDDGYIYVAGGSFNGVTERLDTNPINTCTVDCNTDGIVDTQDFLCFLNLWVAGDAAADFNGDGLVDTQDFLAFLNAWVQGC